MDRSKCVILVPVASGIEPETEACLRELAARGYEVRTLRGSSQVDLARSTLATLAVRDGFEETLWIDADTVFQPEDVERIRRHGKPITAGLYLRKKQGQPEFAAKFVLPRATFGTGGGLLEMVYVGMGFTHVRREVYEAIGHALPSCGGGYEGEKVTPYFLPVLAQEGDGLTYLSEDYSFCLRAKMAGFQVLADTTIKLGHVGRYSYTWDEFAPRRPFESLQLGEPAPQESTEEPMSAKLYEQLGRKQERIEELDTAYDALLGLLAGVVEGSIDRGRVIVNLTERSWSLSPEGQRPAMPATVNGLPKCVVADIAAEKPAA